MTKSTRKPSLYILLPILAGACWGLVGIFVRELTDAGLDNPTIVFTRTSFGLILTLLYCLIQDHRGRTKDSRDRLSPNQASQKKASHASTDNRASARTHSLLYMKLSDLPIALAIGASGTLLLMPCYNIAVNDLTLSLASILLSTAPVFVLLIGAVLFKEKITSKKVICMIFILIGCAMLSGILDGGAMDEAGSSWNPFGFLMGLLTAVFNAAFIILSKVIASRGYNSFTVTFWSFLFSSAVLAFFTDWNALLSYVGSNPAGHLLFLLVQSVCTSLLPSIAYIVSMRHVEAGRVAILESGAEPTAAFIAGLLLYTEIPTPAGFAGMIITIIALMVLTGDRSQD